MRFAAILVLPITLAACSTATPTHTVQAAPACDESTATVAKYQENSGMTAPKLVRRVEVIPRGTSSTRDTSIVTVEAVVAEDGSTQSVCVLSGDPVWGQAVAYSVQKWKYKPATQDGKPVPTRIAVKMTLTRDMFSNNNGVGLCNTPDQVRPCSDPVRPGDLGRPRGSLPGEAQP